MFPCKNLKSILSVALLATVGLIVTGCGDSSATTSTTSTSSGSTPSGTDATWLLDKFEGEFTPVGQAKATAKEGDTVAIFGRIGGHVKPMEAGSPVFLIVDKSVPHCGELPDDHCPTPWDYCCEPRDSLMANSATVKLVDDEGNMLKTDPVAAGLNPLDEIIIVGTVGPRPNEKVLTINATGVHVKQKAGQSSGDDHGGPAHDHEDEHGDHDHS